MTAGLRDALERVSRLLRYPDAGYRAALRDALAAVTAAAPAAGAELARFARLVEDRSDTELQELFTRTFDLNPLAALEVGWHLYAEDYARGAFLVRLRQALRRHAIDEAGELPDHLASVAVLMARLPSGEAAELAATAVGPALDRMLPPLEAADNPFAPLLRAVRLLVTACAPPSGAPLREVAHA